MSLIGNCTWIELALISIWELIDMIIICCSLFERWLNGNHTESHSIDLRFESNYHWKCCISTQTRTRCCRKHKSQGEKWFTASRIQGFSIQYVWNSTPWKIQMPICMRRCTRPRPRSCWFMTRARKKKSTPQWYKYITLYTIIFWMAVNCVVASLVSENVSREWE